jgi:hypothetical protein
MQWLRRFIAKNPAKVFRDGPEPMINMRCKVMRRKVKIFTGKNVKDGLDEKINKWIEENGFELLDVRVDCDIDMNYGIVRYISTVIYTDRTEG